MTTFVSDAVPLLLVSVAVLLAVVHFLLNHLKNPRSCKHSTLPLPPGPAAWPFFGHLFHLKPRLYHFLGRLMPYGPLATIDLFFSKCVVLNTAEAVRAAFVQEGLCGRPDSKLADKVTHNSGIIFQNGHVWKTHRRLSLRILKDLGLGRPIVAHAVEREAADLCAYLSRLTEPVSSEAIFSTATSNVISGVVFGHRPGYEQGTETGRLMENIHVTTQSTNLIELLALTHIPWIEKVAPLLQWIPKMRHVMKSVDYTHDYVIARIAEHRERLSLTEEPSDFLSAYLQEQQKSQSRGENNFDDWKVVRVVLELFIAGSDTSASSLTWGVLFMAMHDDVRQKATMEVHRVLGPDRQITMADKKSLPYIQALVDEIQRFGSITPYGAVPHKALDDCEVLGYLIPRGMLLLTNQYGIFRDPAIWKHPNTFNPENFLNDQGEYVPNPNLIPFSVGKRSCLGEKLARMELFIFVAMLVQRFRFELVLDDSVSFEEVMLGSEGTICAAGEHKIRFHRL